MSNQTMSILSDATLDPAKALRASIDSVASFAPADEGEDGERSTSLVRPSARLPPPAPHDYQRQSIYQRRPTAAGGPKGGSDAQTGGTALAQVDQVELARLLDDMRGVNTRMSRGQRLRRSTAAG